MAAKGAVAKAMVLEKALEVFPNSFSPDGKEVRIDMVEDGQPVQIKLTITAVKVAISNQPKNEVTQDSQHFSITEEEREDLQMSLKELGVDF